MATEAQLQLIKSMSAQRSEALATTHAWVMAQDLTVGQLIDVLKTVPVNADPEKQQVIAALEEAMPGLGGSVSFAASLVSQFRRKGDLSDKQWPHVHSLIAQAGKPQVQLQVGDIAHLGGDEYAIVVSNKEGTGVYAKLLTDTGVQYAKGLISRCRTGRVLTGDEKAAVASRYGIASGRCVFCSKGLSTKESLGVGYGPNCAEKYGLPWGVSV